ncbi:hypothetical protein EOM89_13675 [Candidatus Falkowbacteria bacterium]|nr:hypothetical protein [Candidatus Falkowbacteria bacterium]
MPHDPAAAISAAVAAHADALARHRPDDPASDARLALALARANGLAAAILSSPARTPEAIRAKAAALAWEIEGEAATGFALDDFRAAALRDLLDDLLTLQT